MAWWNEQQYPKPATGTELLELPLVLDPDMPPEDTKFQGMKSVFVRLVNTKISPKQWIIYKVLMTERDINTAIEAMTLKKTFSFGSSKSSKYPTVGIQ